MNAANLTGFAKFLRSIWPAYMNGPKREGRSGSGVIGPAELEGVYQSLATAHPYAVVAA